MTELPRQQPERVHYHELRSMATAPSTLRLALCQIETEPWDVEGNTARTISALEEAGRAGTHLAITPESVIQGYPSHASQAEKERLAGIAEPADGPAISRVRDVAARLGIDVVLGFAECNPNGRTIHNSAAYVTRTGEIAAVYRKVHCRPFEDAGRDGLYTPGNEFAAVDCAVGTAVCRVGIYICFDREIPESTRCLRALGAELVACPLATDTSRLDRPRDRADNEMITRARAAENELYIAVVNHARRFNGGSFVAGPDGEALVQLGGDPEVRVVEIPFGRVRSDYHDRPLGWMGWGYRRPDVYRRYLDPA